MRSRRVLPAAGLAYILLLAPAALPADVATSPDALRLNKEGTELYSEKRYVEALVRFESALFLAPADKTIRANAAEACAALGLQETETLKWEEAGRHFARAVSLCPEEPRFPLWLGMARERGGDPAGAEAAYRKAAALAPEDARPSLALGHLLVAQNRLPEAVEVLEKIASDPAATALLAQAKRDRDFERGLSESGVSLFDIAFDGASNAEASQRVLSMLLLAQTEVANDLGLPQRRKVRVILYSAKDYAEVTQAPEWAAAHYDGKIRLPIRDLDQREREIKATLYHEYVHALLTQALPRCPSWLHEGLAQAEEFGRVAGAGAEATRLKTLSGATLPPIAELERPISSLPADRVPVAYATSLAFVRYLEARFGASGMQVFLSRWAAQPDRPYREAFRDAYGSDLEDLEKDWKASLP